MPFPVLCFLSCVFRNFPLHPPALCAPQEGSITGTEADLRKLGHEEAGRMLMQWGVKKDVVDAMTNRCGTGMETRVVVEGRGCGFGNKRLLREGDTRCWK